MDNNAAFFRFKGIPVPEINNYISGVRQKPYTREEEVEVFKLIGSLEDDYWRLIKNTKDWVWTLKTISDRILPLGEGWEKLALETKSRVKFLGWFAKLPVLIKKELVKSFLLAIENRVKIKKYWNKAILVGNLLKKVRDEVIERNMLLSVKFCQRSFRYMAHLQMSDLLQESAIGLDRAIDRFDWRRNFKFSTYAVWWIRHRITRANTDLDRIIRVPVHVNDNLNKLRKAFAKSRRINPLLTFEDFLVSNEVSKRQAAAFVKAENVISVTSLDVPKYDDSGESIDIPDENKDPTSGYLEKQQIQFLEECLTSLDERSRKIIEYRYGLKEAGYEPRTLEEIGQIMGLTRERIRQLEIEVVGKLRRVAQRKLQKLGKDGIENVWF